MPYMAPIQLSGVITGCSFVVTTAKRSFVTTEQREAAAGGLLRNARITRGCRKYKPEGIIAFLLLPKPLLGW